MAGYNGSRMAYKGNSPSTRTMGVKPYGSDGKPNYKKAPKADLYKGFRRDGVRGQLPASEKEQLARREGRMANEKLYQMPNDRYTNGKMKDTRQRPPGKPKQLYGVRNNSVSVTPSNKRATPSAAGKKFIKTNAMPKAKPIKSIADLKGRAKSKGVGGSSGGY